MIIKATRKASFTTMLRTSLVFKVLIFSLPLTFATLVTLIFDLTISIAVAPFILLWKLVYVVP